MKISLIQYNILWEDKQGNFEKLSEMLGRVPDGTELVILPEMFNTGFSPAADTLAENPRSLTFEWMQNTSREKGFAIAGSYMVAEGGNHFNRWVFISPEGGQINYDKRHLFKQAGVEVNYTPGSERVVFKYRGVRVCPNVCYDLRFPVWSRNRNDYDLLINSSNWPEARRDVWLTLLKARAIENQCFVAGVNRTGIDGMDIKYSGDSMMIGPKGEIMASGELYQECIVSCELSIEELNEFRSKFPAAADADNFTINL
ncbi:MAG: amidohydrolase [Bacteroidales bacterium]|nr:amidohydrolase [Bacteroidales bacterium]